MTSVGKKWFKTKLFFSSLKLILFFSSFRKKKKSYPHKFVEREQNENRIIEAKNDQKEN